MEQIMLNDGLGAFEIDSFERPAPRHDDHVLESIGLRAEPQPFTQIGFPPPCNLGDEETAPNRP